MNNPLSPFSKRERRAIDAWSEHCGDEHAATVGLCERYMMDIEDMILKASRADDPAPGMAAADQHLFRLGRQLDTMPGYTPDYTDEAAEQVVGWLKDAMR